MTMNSESANTAIEINTAQTAPGAVAAARSALQLDPELMQSLENFRLGRGFNPEAYVSAKQQLLVNYLTLNKIRACVIGISGGVDSATTLSILQATAKAHPELDLKIIPVLLPLFVQQGATNQATATARGQEVAAALGLTAIKIDLSHAHAAVAAAVESQLNCSATAWASGQLVANIRTPALYHVATLMAQ